MSSNRYQNGTLEKRKSAKGLMYFLRFRQREGDSCSRPRLEVGLVSSFSTKTDLKRAIEAVRSEFNSPAAAKPKPVMLFGDVIAKYEEKAMPDRYSTSQSYKSILKVHVKPKWGALPVSEVTPPEVEDWILKLRTTPRKPGGPTHSLAPKTQGHVKGVMSVLLRYAMFLGAMPAAVNPMTLFTISSKRKKKPRILTQAEFKVLVEKITTEPFRTMVIVAGCLGLGASELIGIRWEDIDWIEGVVKIHTGVVNGRVDDVKNEFRRKPLPIHPKLIEVLEAHRSRSKFKEDDDWVFASPYTAGETPYDPGDARKKHIVPAAAAAGLGDEIGWHTFRHSYRAWLGQKKTPLELQRDLMRHSNIATTMDIYGGTFSDELREANATVVEGLLQ